MLSVLLVNGVLVPLIFGIAVAVLAIVARVPMPTVRLIAGLAVVAAYVALEGVPPFPPNAVKQKLAYMLVTSAMLVAMAALTPRWRAPLLVGLAGTFALACLFWLAEPILARASEFGAVFAPLAYTVLASAAACALLIPNDPIAPRALIRLPSVLAYCIGGAAVAALGGFIGMGQMFGAFAALAGGIVLVGYVAVVRGNSAIAVRLDGLLPALLLPALATGIVVAFYATSLDVVANTILPLTLIVGLVLSRSGRLDRLPRAIGPLVQGGIIALPALLSITMAALP
jgi:hypothetical protein